MDLLLIFTIGIGIVIGALAALITRSRRYGILINIGAGILGAIFGVWAIAQIHYSFENDKFLSSLVAAGLISTIVVWVMALLRRKG